MLLFTLALRGTNVTSRAAGVWQDGNFLRSDQFRIRKSVKTTTFECTDNGDVKRCELCTEPSSACVEEE